MANLHELYEAIVSGDAKTAGAIADRALQAGKDPLDLVTNYMVPAMDEVGRRFQCAEYFVPELMLSARAMKTALNLITPLLVKQGAPSAGRVAIGTVKGDLHDIGKNLVASMLQGGGFEVHDLGCDVPAEKFVEAVRTANVDVLCLSALLTTTMQVMRLTIEGLRNAGLRDRVKVLVGGAPVTEQYAREIGADGYGENATVAVSLARTMLRLT